MRHDPHQYDYEPEVETGWCSSCHKECDIIGVDQGIGGYEFWGHRGRHVDIRAASDCCEADVLECDPSD